MTLKHTGKEAENLAKPMKVVRWIGPSKKDLRDFPDEVQKDIGRALMWAQLGGKHQNAKPWKGLGPGVWEIVSDHNTDTYRAIYTVKIGDVIYVLHTSPDFILWGFPIRTSSDQRLLGTSPKRIAATPRPSSPP